MTNFFVLFFVCTLLTEGLTELITKSKFFSFFRDFFARRAAQDKKVSNFINSILECPYCSSVWVSCFLIVLIYIGSIAGSIRFYLTGFIFVDLFVLLILAHRGSNYLHNFVDRHLDKYYLGKE